MEEATVENISLTLVPRTVMAARQTTAIRASSRPYSARVAASSSRVMNFLAAVRILVMVNCSCAIGWREVNWQLRQPQGPNGGYQCTALIGGTAVYPWWGLIKDQVCR